MPGVATKGNKIQTSMTSNHIRIKKPNEYTCEPGYIGGEYYSGYWYGGVCYGVLTPPSSPYIYDNINGTIDGEVNEGSSNVFVNGKAVAFSGAKTLEKDTYTVPNGWTVESGNHTSAHGSITRGSSTVFVNGKPLVRNGDSALTHANSTTKINEGSSNVFSN
ncbi:PAAR domain-containing protein [Lysinibacillus sp. CNPSo 3705]|uniref:PAAR domain-containing protein n=1 Tax=Lysinibacillus sp. CNPSo 3705 TaxID=3028148 RepID=UPI002364A6A2|nr:PAAR domain-containing protein [Lysinibacillus sp. CNPSo 3705]MDD1502586.1 PAAR domain-containing protein [Lysinibacillus sp. CNPSo 3705]